MGSAMGVDGFTMMVKWAGKRSLFYKALGSLDLLLDIVN
jgi:hypothetical protein